MKALSIQNLTKTYKNGVKALKDVSLDVEKGDFFALLGPNGAGKTTLIGIINSLVNKTSGKVYIFGHDIDNQFEIAKSYLGIVPQEFNVNIFESLENILLYQAGYYGISRKIAKERIAFYLKKMDLWNKRHHQARALSGGMKRRLMIARALIHQPKLLILDEPTAGVDVELRRSMWSFLREINQSGITIILTTHYLEEAENLCRNVAIIDHGKIIENTNMYDMLSKLNTETFVLYLKHPLSQAPILPGFRCRLINENTLEVDIENTQSINELFQLLSQQHIEVASFKNKANRLEELFLNLTGAKNDEPL